MIPSIVFGALSFLLAAALATVIVIGRREERFRLARLMSASVETRGDPILEEVARIRSELSGSLGEILSELNQSERAGTRLSRNIQKSLIFTADISTDAEKNLDTARRLRNDVTEGSSAVEQIMASIESLSKQVMEQLRAVETTGAAMTQIDSALQNVLRIASDRLQDTDNLIHVTQIGNGKVSDTDRIIRNIREKVRDVSELIRVINSIASKTNLLAMNAAIEAAHAGDAGRGFAVVAEEIRNLATSTSENSKTISGTLNELVEQIKEAGEFSRSGGEAFVEISQGVTSVTESFKEIGRHTSEISGRSREVVDSAQALKEIATRTAESMEEMGVGSREIGKILSSSLGIADALDSSMEHLTAKARDLNLTSTRITDSFLKANRSHENLSRKILGLSGSEDDGVQQRIGISNIILSHINWTATARAVMDGTIDSNDVNLVDSGSCLLGKWLVSHGEKHIPEIEKRKGLTETHEMLHRTVGRLISDVRSGDRAAAGRKYEELLDISKKIVQILTTIGSADFIRWDPTLSVKVETFDEHHRRLIGLINKLFVNMESGQGDEALSRTFSELIEYTDYHFGAEQKAFENYGYPEREDHVRQHESLLKKARELQSGFLSDRSVLSNEVLDFLQDWVTNHILKTDRRYSDFLQGKAV